jgi:hypothetical protein
LNGLRLVRPFVGKIEEALFEFGGTQRLRKSVSAQSESRWPCRPDQAGRDYSRHHWREEQHDRPHVYIVDSKGRIVAIVD